MLSQRTIPIKTSPDRFAPLLKALSCPCCRAKGVRFRSDYPSRVKPFAAMKVLWCSRCGAGHVRRAGPILNAYYKEDYAALNRNDRSADPPTYFSESYRVSSKKIGRYFARAVRQLHLLHALGAKVGNVLDYGSGPGYFLYLAKGEKSFAFEPDTASAKYLRYIGADHLTTLDDVQRHKFDVIVASHSIEHLPSEDLLPTLRLLISSLSERGLFLIEVPQGGHSFADLDTRQDPHTLFFTPEAITRAVENAGGKIIYSATAAVTETPRSATPIYIPQKGNYFFNDTRGGLTIVCRRRQLKRPSLWKNNVRNTVVRIFRLGSWNAFP